MRFNLLSQGRIHLEAFTRKTPLIGPWLIVPVLAQYASPMGVNDWVPCELAGSSGVAGGGQVEASAPGRQGLGRQN